MRTAMRVLLVFLLFLAATPVIGAEKGWWIREPLRWLQTNFRQTDAAVDAKQLVVQAAALKANVLHVGMGGIAAYYPTRVPFHPVSPYLPQGKDLFGELLAEAHARGIRVVGRFDFSKTRQAAFDAHPEWFFRKANGEPVIYNELYSACINGGWYQQHIFAILEEALDRYDVDGLFFNMFGNQSRDYSGNFVGHCHCEACKKKFRAAFGRDLPPEPDDDYRRFLAQSAREVSERIGRLIHDKRPNAGYFNYIQETTDGIMSESNTAVSRPLPLWPYASSDNVNRARNSQPDKASVNLCMQFVDYAWRFATVPDGEIRLRLWQNLAHGGALAFAVNGTLDQQDRQAVDAARPIFAWAAEHQAYYAAQESAARVLLLGGGETESYRGLFRLLSEEHIPFAVSNNLDWMGKRSFDLVVAADRAPIGLKEYVAGGGRVLVAHARKPEFIKIPAGSTLPDMQGYARIRKPEQFPSLKRTTILMLDGPFTETTAAEPAELTLIPPSMFGPPELIHTDMRETDTPALLWMESGRVAWVPWNLGALYYRLSLPSHAGLFRDLLNRMLPRGRQLETDAHPLVEMALMQQPGRLLLHMINLTGHSQTAYFAPLSTGSIKLRLEGGFKSARALRSGEKPALKQAGGRTELVLSGLRDYELVILEK
jgi:hypothetical protein